MNIVVEFLRSVITLCLKLTKKRRGKEEEEKSTIKNVVHVAQLCCTCLDNKKP